MRALENVGDVTSKGTRILRDVTCIDFQVDEVVFFDEACGERDRKSGISECYEAKAASRKITAKLDYTVKC